TPRRARPSAAHRRAALAARRAEQRAGPGRRGLAWRNPGAASREGRHGRAGQPCAGAAARCAPAGIARRAADMTAFLAIVARDLRLGAGAQGAMLTTLLFFVLAVSLFPLGVGPEPQILARIASGAIWVAALLAAMLSLDRLFQADQEDGTLDLLAQAPLPLGLVALAKTLAHWLTTGLPLALIAPLLALLMQMETEAIPVLLLS